MTTNKTIFKVIFYNESKVYEIFALEVYPSDMMGFVTVEQLTFGERSTLVVDPGEEKLKLEFESVERTYIPTHAIIRIDEVRYLTGNENCTFKADLYRVVAS